MVLHINPQFLHNFHISAGLFLSVTVIILSNKSNFGILLLLYKDLLGQKLLNSLILSMQSWICETDCTVTVFPRTVGRIKLALILLRGTKPRVISRRVSGLPERLFTSGRVHYLEKKI